MKASAAVERVPALVGGQAEGVILNMNPRAFDPVGVAPDRRAEKAAARKIFLRRIIAENDIRRLPVPVRDGEGLHGAAKVGHRRADAAALSV